MIIVRCAGREGGILMANGNNTINMGEQYFKGILAAYLGANFFNSPVDEWQM